MRVFFHSIDKSCKFCYNMLNEMKGGMVWMPTMSLSEVGVICTRICGAVGTVVLGAEETIRGLMIAALCGGHVLLEDLPGSGKTTLVKAFAKAIGCSCKRVQCTPDLMPADLTGFQVYTQRSDGIREMVFREGPVFTNLLLADEINRMAPRTQSGLLECMAERQVTCDGVTHQLPAPFLVIATQNPIEMQGTFPLPEAQLDRFLLRLTMGRPTRAQETEILTARQSTDPLDVMPTLLTPQDLLAAQDAVREVRIEPIVLQYLLDLADATRTHAQLRFGISTRAVLALRHAAQAHAVLEGRDYLLADDIKAMLPAAWAHRLGGNSGFAASTQPNGRNSVFQILHEILSTTEAPR